MPGALNVGTDQQHTNTTKTISNGTALVANTTSYAMSSYSTGGNGQKMKQSNPQTPMVQQPGFAGTLRGGSDNPMRRRATQRSEMDGAAIQWPLGPAIPGVKSAYNLSSIIFSCAAPKPLERPTADTKPKDDANPGAHIAILRSFRDCRLASASE